VPRALFAISCIPVFREFLKHSLYKVFCSRYLTDKIMVVGGGRINLQHTFMDGGSTSPMFDKIMVVSGGWMNLGCTFMHEGSTKFYFLIFGHIQLYLFFVKVCMIKYQGNMYTPSFFFLKF
jgi:hypothetical protein